MMVEDSKGPVTGGANKQATGRGRTNRDWWPNQLRLEILHPHASKSNPMDEDFNYAEEFKNLDLAAVKKDLAPLNSWPDNVSLDKACRLQVFFNLILNAVGALPNGGGLHLSTFSKQIARDGLESNPREYAEIRIEDTGIGMEPEVLANMVSPFLAQRREGRV